MSISQIVEPPIADFQLQAAAFHRDFITGLRTHPRKLSPKYLYDKRGSDLFEQICTLDEYFPTRTEIGILRQYQEEISKAVGSHCRIVEFGSGSSVKTRLLLEILNEPIAYLPIEISRQALQAAALQLVKEFPALEILPICADYTSEFALPVPDARYAHTVVYFPGSSIGNFETHQAVQFLDRARKFCGPDCGLLIGVGLETDPDVLIRAYDDAAGVTAAFSRNILYRAQRELDAQVAPEAFQHEAIYNRAAKRIEIRLVSRRPQAISVQDEVFAFSTGDAIITEYSHKFTIPRFQRIARRAGFDLRRAWTDPDQRFAVIYLEASPHSIEGIPAPQPNP